MCYERATMSDDIWQLAAHRPKPCCANDHTSIFGLCLFPKPPACACTLERQVAIEGSADAVIFAYAYVDTEQDVCCLGCPVGPAMLRPFSHGDKAVINRTGR